MPTGGTLKVTDQTDGLRVRPRGSPLRTGLESICACDQIDGARDYQEDACEVLVWDGDDPDGCDILLVLADGMGGHRGGAKASELAVAAARETFSSARGGIGRRLRTSLDVANKRIREWAENDARYGGMGCTLVVCAITTDEELHWVSVGDSPLWLVRKEEGAGGRFMRRVNEDHSMRPVLEEMARQGHITEYQVRRGSHQLRSALTGDDLGLVDEGAAPLPLQVGDRVILASDGVETLPEERICDLGRVDRHASEIAASLLDAVEACKYARQDNASVVVYCHMGPGTARRRMAQLAAPTARL